MIKDVITNHIIDLAQQLTEAKENPSLNAYTEITTQAHWKVISLNHQIAYFKQVLERITEDNMYDIALFFLEGVRDYGHIVGSSGKEFMTEDYRKRVKIARFWIRLFAQENERVGRFSYIF